jgi:hypothetical protein
LTEFEKIVDDILVLHRLKQADYGRKEDPFANVRASEDYGVSGVIGALIRMNDKMRRLQSWAKGSTLKNEGVEDSLMDLAVYSIIALVLYRESKNKK